MKFLYKTVLASAMFASLPVAQAAPPFQFSANVALTSDYVFRGLTQTDGGFAIQGEFDANHESGVYVGTWASNVKFLEDNTVNPEDRADIEVDLYIGYNGELANGLSYGVKATHFIYPGAGSHLNYDMSEFNLSLGYSLPQGTEFGFSYDYSPEFFGEVGQAHHYGLSASHTLANGIGLGGNIGKQTFNDNAKAGDDYIYYGLSALYTVADFKLSLDYTNADLNGADDRVFFTLAKSF